MLQCSQSLTAWLRGFRKSVTFDALYPDWEQTIRFFSCLSVTCEASFTVCQLPKSPTATNWPIFRISASIYVISIVVLFYSKRWLEFTAVKPLWLAPQNAENCIPEVQNFKISREACPCTPLDTPAPGGRLFLGAPFLSSSLSPLYRVSCFRISKC